MAMILVYLELLQQYNMTVHNVTIHMFDSLPPRPTATRKDGRSDYGDRSRWGMAQGKSDPLAKSSTTTAKLTVGKSMDSKENKHKPYKSLINVM
jgi:hypothetical protein